MPTGYTAPITEGEQTFHDFALHCARAFTPAILLRDSPDTPLTPETVTRGDQFPSYHVEGLRNARERLAEVESWSATKAVGEAAAESTRILNANAASLLRSEETVARINALLAEVDSWEPPSEDHVGLKNFMRSQLVDELRYQKPFEQKIPVYLSSGEAFKAHEIERAKEQITYHEAELAEERERDEQRAQWVRQLLGSLPTEATV